MGIYRSFMGEKFHRRQLPILALSAGLALAGCKEAQAGSNYGDLLAHPERYWGQQVTFRMSNQYLITLGNSDIFFSEGPTQLNQQLTQARIALATLPGERDRLKNPLIMFYDPLSTTDFLAPNFTGEFSVTGIGVKRDIETGDPTAQLPFGFYIKDIKE